MAKPKFSALSTILPPEQYRIWDQFEREELNALDEKNHAVYTLSMKVFAAFLKNIDFVHMTKEQLKAFVIYLHTQYSNARTINAITSRLKRFMKWIAETQDQELPACFKKVLKPLQTQAAVAQSELLSEEVVFKIIKAGKTLRDQALFALLFEGCGRLNEIAQLRIKDIVVENGITYLYKPIYKLGAKGKKDEHERRKIPLNKALIFLTNWLRVHPCREDKDAPLFCTLYRGEYKPIGGKQPWQALKQAAINAGVDQRIYPHLLRHSAITDFRNRGLSDKQTRYLAGWTASSTMLKVYDHFTQESSNELAAFHGFKPATKKQEPVLCPRCGEKNWYETETCQRCFTPFNAPLTEDRITQLEHTIQRLEKIIGRYDQATAEPIADEPPDPEAVQRLEKITQWEDAADEYATKEAQRQRKRRAKK